MEILFKWTVADHTLKLVRSYFMHAQALWTVLCDEADEHTQNKNWHFSFFFLSGNDKNIIILTHVIHFLFRVIDEFAVLSEYENLFNKGGKIHWF